MSQRFSVRCARPTDLRRILAIERAGFGEWAWDRNTFAEYARVCGDLFLVVCGERVIGYSIACISRRLLVRRGELVSIAVEPASRGKGAADALLSATLRSLKRRGVSRIALTVRVTNERARAFYERYGFRKVRRIRHYYEDGEDGYVFRLDL
jgi:ribosomal-protein-alanine N-acetyltransferase